MLNNEWNSYCLKNFISLKINDDFDLLAVWACKPYIEEYYIYQYINFDKINRDTIIMGDFNSNKIWDNKHSDRNHSMIVQQLENKQLVSAYHYVYNEEQGKESNNTFYLYRHLDKGYHIDHCFINNDRIKSYKVLSEDSWLKFSDHLPICLEIY